jgi:hypothetical protein
VADLADLDLGFSPCTNISTIRRLDLAVGQEKTLDVLWLDTGDWKLKNLRQTYARHSADTYRYASPDHGFTADLCLDADGRLTRYGDLWQAEQA